MAQPNGQDPIFERIYTKVPIIADLGATRTLSVDESGATIVCNRAAGIIVTLPLAVPGLVYDFDVTVSVTSNNYKIITGAATEFLVGSYVSQATAIATFAGNGTTHIAFTMNGTTTGGLVGTKIRVKCLTNTRWSVEGINQGSGTGVTAYATS
jgi:hypothetical protein